MAYNTNTTDSTSSINDNTIKSSGTRYSDLNLQMMIHPQKKDIIPLKNEEAVKNAVRTLIITNFFERPFQPNLGANLRSLLFEPADAITRLAIKDAVQNILEMHEPRIENINIIIETTNDESEYAILVVFSIKENDSVQDVEINLRRLR
tara:strand:+ start:724 stop:1170 length:447 start_codon:yes stop_codon:yes gene_type:complete